MCLRRQPAFKAYAGLPTVEPSNTFLTRNGAGNVWEQSLSGGNPQQVTHFISGLIFDFSWSHEGKQMLLSRGERISDVVLISKFR